MSDRETTAAINLALRKRFAAPEWALLFNVGDATGARHSRFADAVAMSLWPSRGLELHGMEVKASRADWQRERQKPQKAETIAAFCEHWWIVAAKGAVKEDEVPPAWGWIEFTGDKLITVKPSTRTDAEPMTRTFLAALLRRASEADEVLLKAAIESADKERAASFDRRLAEQVQWRMRDAAQAEETLKAFEAASGVSVPLYQGEQIGLAVKAVLASGVTDAYGGLFDIMERLGQARDRINEALTAAGYEPPKQRDLFLQKRKRA